MVEQWWNNGVQISNFPPGMKAKDKVNVNERGGVANSLDCKLIVTQLPQSSNREQNCANRVTIVSKPGPVWQSCYSVAFVPIGPQWWDNGVTMVRQWWYTKKF